MFLYLPYGTDAPIYYRPIVTIAMIVINVLVFFMFTQEQVASYMLAVGAGLHPVQWLTTNFLHADIFHLASNMIFLWIFGLVVEGKLGTFRMLAVYLGIGILYGATTQIMMLGQDPTFCLGASAVIFGLAAMALIWAPANRIDALLIVWFGFYLRSKNFDAKISVLVGIFLALDIAMLLLVGGALSTPLLHLVGAIVGAIVGIVMLKMNYVDCEHWDIISVWKGENLLTDEERAAIEEKKPENIKRREEARLKHKNLLTEEIELALTNKKPLPAYIIAQRKEREFPEWFLPQELHLKMIQQLLVDKHLEAATASMRQYLERHREQSSFVRIMLAQALLTQNKPGAAIKVLDSISMQEAGTEQAIQKIRAKAEAMHRKNMDEGFYEMGE